MRLYNVTLFENFKLLIFATYVQHISVKEEVLALFIDRVNIMVHLSFDLNVLGVKFSDNPDKA